MKYSDKLISLAIKYQTEVSRWQQAMGYDHNSHIDVTVNKTFSDLRQACEYVDQFMPDNVVPFAPKQVI
jgi:hypothetical protein